VTKPEIARDARNKNKKSEIPTFLNMTPIAGRLVVTRRSLKPWVRKGIFTLHVFEIETQMKNQKLV
jgi:hypothetical protein